MLHPELLHEVCGFPGQRRPRLRGGSVEFGLKRRLVGLNDGGCRGQAAVGIARNRPPAEAPSRG